MDGRTSLDREGGPFKLCLSGVHELGMYPIQARALLSGKQPCSAITVDQTVVQFDIRPAPGHQLSTHNPRVDSTRSLAVTSVFFSHAIFTSANA
jgi:hypothetical protein